VQRDLAPGASTFIEFPLGHSNVLLMRANVRITTGVYRGGSFWFQIDIPKNYPFRGARLEGQGAAAASLRGPLTAPLPTPPVTPP